MEPNPLARYAPRLVWRLYPSILSIMKLTTIAIIFGAVGFAFGMTFTDGYLQTAAASSEAKLSQCEEEQARLTASIQRFINEVK